MRGCRSSSRPRRKFSRRYRSSASKPEASNMAAFIPLLTGLVTALLPLVPKLLTGQITLAEAVKAANEAVQKFQGDLASLAATEAADDAAAQAALDQKFPSGR